MLAKPANTVEYVATSAVNRETLLSENASDSKCDGPPPFRDSETPTRSIVRTTSKSSRSADLEVGAVEGEA
jgi:hypothetical protein